MVGRLGREESTSEGCRAEGLKERARRRGRRHAARLPPGTLSSLGVTDGDTFEGGVVCLPVDDTRDMLQKSHQLQEHEREQDQDKTQQVPEQKEEQEQAQVEKQK